MYFSSFNLISNFSGVSQEPTSRSTQSASPLVGNPDAKQELKNTLESKVTVSEFSPNEWTHKGELTA